MTQSNINEIFASIVEKEAGERTIEVLLRDKGTGEFIGKRVIKRALLARFMQPLTEHQVSAHQGKFVLEV